MSGRSAYVRAKNTERADKSHHKIYPEYTNDDHFLYSCSGGPESLSRPTISTNPSYVSSPRQSRRRQSISSTSSTYGYPAPPMRKPRPIIVASAIEKSDFRTHFDGMSSTLRCKLGRLLKGGEDNGSNRRRPGTGNGSSDSESRSAEFTPSITAVPSLSPSTSPEIPPPFPAARSPTHAMKAKQQKEAVIHKIRRFEGGGKLPQLGWKSLSNVRTKPSRWRPELIRARTRNFGTTTGIHSCTCICMGREQNRHHRSESTHGSSSSRDPKFSWTN